MTTEQPNPEQGIKAGEPTPVVPPTSIQEGAPQPESIPLPALPPSAPPPYAPRWSLFDCVLILFLLALGYLLGSSNAANSDFWRHLATGRAIAQGNHQFGVDLYSFASNRGDGTPVPWINHSWLYDLGVFGIWSAAGDQARIVVVAAHALLMVGVVILLLRTCASDSGSFITLVGTALALVVCSQVIQLNSLMVSYFFFAALLYLLHRGGLLCSLADDEESSPRMRWLTPLLFVLWVNVDAWFVLGLAVLALCVLGNALAKLLRWKVQSPMATQGLVLLASVVACLISPFHVRGLTVPPELSYLFGGGGMLRELGSLAGIGLVWPFHPTYFGSLSVVKVAYFVLLLGSFVSFALNAAILNRPNGPGVALARLLPWSFAAALSLLGFGFIPWFALIAGPTTVLNVTEFARWRRRQPSWNSEAGFNPNLARLSAAVLLLIGLALCWPGWLHSRFMAAYSSRRVVWQVQVDPSLQAAAEVLSRTHAKQVFNFTNDIAAYCAWFAPETRCCLDERYELFGHNTAQVVKVSKELREDAHKAVGAHEKRGGVAWGRFFREHKIDHMALTRFVADLDHPVIAQMCWLQENDWAQQYADGRTLVFAYVPAGEVARVDLGTQWRREAFGLVPEERRAPAVRADESFSQGGLPPQDLYLKGQPAWPSLAATEPKVHQAYFQLIQMHGLVVYEPAWQVASWLGPMGMCGVVPLHVFGAATLGIELDPPRKGPQGPVPLFQRLQRAGAREPGPPAAPLLMIRLARRAIHDHPYQADGYLALFYAYQLQSERLEKHWTAAAGMPPDGSGRNELRDIQMITALRSYLELRPDHFEIREHLARMFFKLNHLDAMQEELKLAHASVTQLRQQARDKKSQEFWKKKEKDMADFVKKNAKEVNRSLEDFKLKTARMEPFRKFIVAVLEPPAGEDPRGPKSMGLTLEGLRQLQNVTPESLSGQDRGQFHSLRFRYLMQLGRLSEANEDLLQLVDLRSPLALQNLVIFNAALGNYADLDKNLEISDRSLVDAIAVKREQLRNTSLVMLQQSASVPLPGIARAPAKLFPVVANFATLESYLQTMSERANLRTLRGLAALEAGDTAAAELHFVEALRGNESNPLFFDQPIAQRYLELLREQKQAK